MYFYDHFYIILDRSISICPSVPSVPSLHLSMPRHLQYLGSQPKNSRGCGYCGLSMNLIHKFLVTRTT